MASFTRDFQVAGSNGTLRMQPTQPIDYRDSANTYWAFREYTRSKGKVDRVRDRLAPACSVWYRPGKNRPTTRKTGT